MEDEQKNKFSDKSKMNLHLSSSDFYDFIGLPKAANVAIDMMIDHHLKDMNDQQIKKNKEELKNKINNLD